jgi:ClpP class serine protease
MIGEAFRALLPNSWHQSHPVVPVIRMIGPIGLPPSPFRQSLSMAQLAGPLEAAFKLKRANAVALVINSPGGSPVQSTLIFKRIRALADEHDKTVHVFIEDVGAVWRLSHRARRRRDHRRSLIGGRLDWRDLGRFRI